MGTRWHGPAPAITVNPAHMQNFFKLDYYFFIQQRAEAQWGG